HLVRTEQLLSADKNWERTLLSPSDLLREAMPAIALKARAQDIRFQCRVELSGEELLLGNAQGFKLIVTNLAEHAMKFSDADSEVRVEAAVQSSELVIVVASDSASMEDLELCRLVGHISPQQHEQGSGGRPYGIGLYIVKRLVDHFDGVIEAERSADGAGTIVFVKLPLTQGSLMRLR